MEQQICVSMSIFCIVRKNWPYPPTASGPYSREAGREKGWKTKYGWILKFLRFSTGSIILIFVLCNITAMLLRCYNSGYCLVELSLRCVLKCEKFGCHFIMSISTIRTNIPNDYLKASHNKSCMCITITYGVLSSANTDILQQTVTYVVSQMTWEEAEFHN